jgi:hypothetical protein
MSFLRFMATEARKYAKATETIVSEGRKWFGEHERFKELEKWKERLTKGSELADKLAVELEKEDGDRVSRREAREHEVSEVPSGPSGDRTVETDGRRDAGKNVRD